MFASLYPNTGHIDLVLVDQDNSKKGRVTQRDITTSDYDTGEDETSVNVSKPYFVMLARLRISDQILLKVCDQSRVAG